MSDQTNAPSPHESRHDPQPSRRGFLASAAAGGAVGHGLGGWQSAAAATPARHGPAVNPRLFSFAGGKTGEWAVVEIKTVVGDPLPAVKRLQVVNGPVAAPADGTGWVLRGVTSNERYVTRAEKESLVRKQAALGRPDATQAALIPIRKNARWWGLTQDERRAIFEDRSRHIQVGLKYLPAVARRLHHCRDLDASEPFDFVTLFDYAPADARAFDELLAALRMTEEWKFVDREVDIRLLRVKA